MVKPLVVGLDLSLTATGVALATPAGIVGAGLVRSSGSREDSWARREQRLTDVEGGIHRWIHQNACAPVCGVFVEGPAYSSTTGSVHDRSGLWWLVYGSFMARNVPVFVVQPTSRAKYATGKGNANKDSVLAATVKQFLNVDITDNNVADAVQLAAMGARHQGFPVDGAKSKACLEAMEKIAS